MNIFTFFKNKHYKDKEMVSYWQRQDKIEAKQMKTDEGYTIMQMKGEKYPFPGFPRGVLLYGGLSPLKHEIKNQVFNDTWARLDKGEDPESIIANIKENILPRIYATAEKTRYDMVPPERLNPPVKELYRAMTAIENGNKHIKYLKEIVCFIFQEDDSYRMRFQWLAKFFNPNSVWRRITKRDPLKDFDLALSMLEHGEVVGDMKERQRLLRRVVMFCLSDPNMRSYFKALVKELDWNKVKLTKADKYFFRAKYFKVDYPEYKY